MKLIATFIMAFLFFISTAYSQLIDSFSDGDFTSNPAWVGDIGSWEIVTDSDVSTGATNSFTLRLNAPGTNDTEYLSLQRTESWGTEQTWGFWIGRRNYAVSASNQSIVWLWANEADVTSATVDGYRIVIGDNSGDEEFYLQRVDNGSSTNILSSSGAITNSSTDYGVLIRVSRNSNSDWTLYSCILPTSDGSGPVATDLPSSSATNINQGTTNDNTYTDFSNGYFSLAALHSTAADPTVAAEFDQFYFEPSADASLPVELLNFNALPAGNSIRLNWATASEIDNLGFIIERAESAGGPFRTIASHVDDPALRGALNSSITVSYSYDDAAVFRNQLYWYRLCDVDINGTKTIQATAEAFLPLDAAEAGDSDMLPGEFTLGNYPNPFNPSTTVYFDISLFHEAQVVTDLSVYNLLGQRVTTMYHGELTPARYAFDWAGKNDRGQTVPAGIYICRLQSGGRVLTQRLVFLK